ncbi:hypothetical protein [Pseudomonas sp. NPDC089734]|uniref:hypothetical protein n=1 Tax=Pseudomonas sp. NPDC089734 TaxID=3364469 RepID=UPI003813EC41
MSIKEDFIEALRVAGHEFGCDKVSPHNYHVFYAAHLLDYIDRPFRLLEIGIGGEDRETGGASLKLWERVFPSAHIYGIDLYPKTALDSERIKTFVCDQGDPVALEAFARQHGPFDVIIDDGSHKRSDQLTSLFSLIKWVLPGGYYVLEDYFTSYWPVYDGSTLAKDFLDTPVRWLKQTVDIINRPNFLSPESKAFVPDWGIDELHVYAGVSFLKKAQGQGRSEIPSEEFFENQLELDELRYGRFKETFMAYAQDPMSNLIFLEKLKTLVENNINAVKDLTDEDPS